VRIGDAVGEAILGGVVDGVDEGSGGVTEDVGAPGAYVVNVAVAVDVFDACSFGALDEERVAVDIFEGADGGVDTAGDEGFGFGEEFGRERMVHGRSLVRERLGVDWFF